MVLKSTITCLYFNTFMFSLVFRNVLIRFADRGLVVDGKPHLRLFRQIYWVVFWAFFITTVTHFPILALLRGTFTHYIQARVEKNTKFKREAKKCGFSLPRDWVRALERKKNGLQQDFSLKFSSKCVCFTFASKCVCFTFASKCVCFTFATKRK